MSHADGGGIRFGYAGVNGQRLHYAAAGQGRLMLFLHGFPEFWYAWREQLTYFGADHLAVAPDMRGFNLSSKPADIRDYRARHLIEDVRQLALHFDGQRFTLVAHDWGGAVAWSFAAAHPEMLDRLVIINAPHPVTFARELAHNAEQARASAYMNLFRSDKAERVLSDDGYRRLREPMFAGGAFSDADRAAYVEAWGQPGALTGGLNYYRASPLYPPTPEDPGAAALQLDAAALRVEVPVLVLWGEKDTALLTGNLDGLDALVPDLTVRRFPEGTHWLVHEQPDAVNAAIRAFMQR